MKTRAITAFFFTIVMLASVFLGQYTFSIFYIILSTLSLLEFYKLIKPSGINVSVNLGILTSISLFSISAIILYANFDFKYLLLIIPLIVLVFLFELYRKQNLPFTNIAYTFLGLFFVTFPFIIFHTLGFINNFQDFNLQFPLAFLLMLWANDTGAYLFGSKFGKHRLFERHSPKKSWEGFFGGVLVSLIVAFIFSNIYVEHSLLLWSGMAILISSFGTLGDLVESMLKRSIDVKDSGSLLPGHGGLLDRFDGLLIAAPVVFVYLYLMLH